MKRIILAAIATIFAMLATPASAQTRTWVSGVGDDLNPCSRTAPCKTFAGAISKTGAGGGINCLNSAGFGAVTIAKSITIDCHTEHGGILSSNTNGVLINAAGITVTLRGLVIDGANSTIGNGIRILNASHVNIDDCIIENMAGTTTNGRGITIETSVTIGVTVTNTHIYNVNFLGIHSNPSAGLVNLAIDNVQIARSGTAMQFRQLTQAAVNRASAINNPGAGIAAELGSVSMNISNSNFSNNAFGVINGNGGSPASRLYATVITGNTTSGLQINGGTVTSLGNNMIQGNAGNQTPSSTITTQ